MNPNEWPFADPPNVAVFADKRILDGRSWIYYIGHDADDGAWQFHGPEGYADEANAKIVGFKTIYELDPSIGELVDLPLGWCAWRESMSSAWQRAPQKT
jgi:hypothetical protein